MAKGDILMLDLGVQLVRRCYLVYGTQTSVEVRWSMCKRGQETEWRCDVFESKSALQSGETCILPRSELESHACMHRV